MNMLLFALLFLSQSFEVVPIAGKLNAPALRRDGIGNEARFDQIGAMSNIGPDLYVADGPTIRKLNLQTGEVSTVTLRAGTGLRTGIHPLNTYRDLADLWNDGTYLYVTDIGAATIRRILPNTGDVSDFASAGSVLWGLTGEGYNFFVVIAGTRENIRFGGSYRSIKDFVYISR